MGNETAVLEKPKEDMKTKAQEEKERIGNEFKKINVLISGTGKMGILIAKKVIEQPDMTLNPFALTGEGVIRELGSEFLKINENTELALREPKDHERTLRECTERYGPVDVIVDFTQVPKGQPSQINRNAELFCKVGIPSVIGTTGGNREKAVETVKNSNVSFVIDTNMSNSLVVVKYAFKAAAEKFPGALDGFIGKIKESHQRAKQDPSGTGKAWQKIFEKLGIFFRDPMDSIRKREDGHAYHWYNFISKDGTVRIKLTTEVDGRATYVDGTMPAIRFIYKKDQEGSKGEVFTMEDVYSELI